MTNRITNGNIYKQILLFFFPILIGSFFQVLYNTIDAIIVGKYVGSAALAAVGGSAYQIINFLVGFFLAMSSGATIVIAKSFGANDYVKTKKAISTALIISVVCGILLIVVGLNISEWALTMLKDPADIFNISLSYVKIIFCGSIFSLVYNIGSGILRALGDSKQPLYFLIVASVVNIVLDLVFIRIFHMGVEGAALATIIAQGVSAVLVVIVLMNEDQRYRFEFKDLKIDWLLLGSILAVGLPAGIQSTFYSVSNMYIQQSINIFGTNTVAAYTAYGKIDGIFWMLMNAFGISAMTFAGQNFGAKNFNRVKETIKASLVMSFIMTFVLSALFYFFSKYFVVLFTSDANVIEIGIYMVELLAPTYFTWVCIEILSSVIRATGDAMGPMIISLVGICILRIIWITFVLPLNNHIGTLLYCYPITWVVTSIAFIIYYRITSQKWI